jgi:hypothetical protein
MATFLLNYHPCSSTGTTTPYQLLFCSPTDYSRLRVFGSLCYPNTMATTTHKLCPRSTTCVFIGYPTDHHGYHYYDLAMKRFLTS